MLEYVQQLKNKLGKLRDLAYSNLERSQSRQKAVYDKGKRWHRLQVDDWVLIILPSSTQKVKAEWKGPYRVVGTVGNTSYRVQMTKTKTQIYHINLLKKWLGKPPDPVHLTQIPPGPLSNTIPQLVINEELTQEELAGL